MEYAVWQWRQESVLCQKSCMSTLIHKSEKHWHHTGICAPSTSNSLIFQLSLELCKVLQRLCAVASPKHICILRSSCGSSVMATQTVLRVLFRVILRVHKPCYGRPM